MPDWILSDQEPSQPANRQARTPAPPPIPEPKSAGVTSKVEIEERKRARIVALQALFEIDSSGHAPDVVLYERMEAAVRARQQAQQPQEPWLPAHVPGAPEAEREEEMEPLGESGLKFLLWLVAGVLSYRERIDSLIHRFAPEWPVEQLAIVDRSILRLALYELGAHEHEAPPKVIINEAVELAKLFGGDSSPRFVNGVLGAAFEEARKQEY